MRGSAGKLHFTLLISNSARSGATVIYGSVNLLVLTSQNDSVCTVTLNRPECLNALNEPLLGALKEAILNANADPSINVIVLRGAGRAFCTGKDLKEHQDLGLDRQATHRAIALLHDISRGILFGEKIVIAGVQGWAVGGGLEIMIACDLVILGESAQLLFPEMSLGLFVTGAVTALLPQMIGFSQAKALFLSDEPMQAQSAKDIGLVWRVVADEEFDKELMQAAQNISLMPQNAQRELKRIMISGLREDIEKAFEMEAKAALSSSLDQESMQRVFQNRNEN